MPKRRPIGLDVRGIDDVRKGLRIVGTKSEAAVADAVTASALAIDRSIKLMHRSANKTGTAYYRIPGDKYMTIRAGSDDGPPVAFDSGGGARNLSRRHVASAPGEPPARDTGVTIASITFRQVSRLTAEVSSKNPVAYWLEFGTQRMEPRPSWQPARDAELPNFRRRVVAALRGAL